MESQNVKIIVFVPEAAADKVREAMAQAGAGKIGNYSGCSFSVKGVGRFTPQSGANPTIGEVGVSEEVSEERIEMVCPRASAAKVIEAMKAAHPYEEVAFDVYSLEDF